MESSALVAAYDGRCAATLQAAESLARVLRLDITRATGYDVGG